MLKSLYPNLDWSIIQAVGFDLDGTLYDECDFIAQVYRPIAEKIASATGGSVESVYRFMLALWLREGSSYPAVFTDALREFGFTGDSRALVDGSLKIFREFSPSLTLYARAEAVLTFLKEKGLRFFLISDGNSQLQRRKFQALGLGAWFTESEILVSGDFGSAFQKPATLILGQAKFTLPSEARAVAFFGDRDKDREFAARAGFQFQPVKAMFAYEKT